MAENTEKKKRYTHKSHARLLAAFANRGADIRLNF
jgi:hypothetical protein